MQLDRPPTSADDAFSPAYALEPSACFDTSSRQLFQKFLAARVETFHVPVHSFLQYNLFRFNNTEKRKSFASTFFLFLAAAREERKMLTQSFSHFSPYFDILSS